MKKNVDCCKGIDILFICFVEFFASISSLEEEDWKEISELDSEQNLKEKFMCVVCLFIEFFVLENVHSNCEFCDSILILSRFSVFESVAFFVVFSTLKNSSSENQSSVSFSSTKKEFVNEKEVVFISCSFVCVFVNSSIESLLVLVFSVSELSFSILWIESSVFLNSKKCEIVREEKKKFLDEKIVIKNDVSNFCETSNSNSSSINELCVEKVKIEKKRKVKKFFLFRILCDRFCFKLFSHQWNWKFVKRRCDH
jgi:hypothetical protein